MGAGHARNLGIEKSKGKFIAFLDSDDYWDKTKIEKQIIFLKEKKIKVFCTGEQFNSEEKKLFSTLKIENLGIGGGDTQA